MASAACRHRWAIDPDDPLSFRRERHGDVVYLVCEKCGHKERER